MITKDSDQGDSQGLDGQFISQVVIRGIDNLQFYQIKNYLANLRNLMDLDQSMQQKHGGSNHLNLIEKIDSNSEDIIIED